MNTPAELQKIYETRFSRNLAFRQALWQLLCADFFQRFVNPDGVVLDLGCGYGEFINNIRARKKYAMDLNPDARKRVAAEVNTLIQDCSAEWAVEPGSLDAVFTSNFFEHLPDKGALGRTLDQARRGLKPGGRLIAMGPNIRYLPGEYWDFWDHYLPLTDKSLTEGLVNHGFEIEQSVPRFLPYTIVPGRNYPLFMVRAYLKLRVAWPFFGRQFLVVARRSP